MRISLGRWSLVAALSLAAVTGHGCGRKSLPNDEPGSGGTGVGIVGAGGNGGQGVTGVGGAAGVAAACVGASDPRMVVADQRILRLTMNETLNTIRYLIGEIEAAALVKDGIVGGDDSVEWNRRFPPLQEPSIDDGAFRTLDLLADHVATYVLANFAVVTACPTATDACATAYLDKLAARAYRRKLTPDEQSRFAALYDGLRAAQTVNGYEVTFTVEEATGYAVSALLHAPQMLWRWEIGDPAMASLSPAGIPLTDQELATQLSFFFTDRPPDETLLAAANAGTLRANLAAHVDALLASQVARDWLRTIMETYVGINRLPTVSLDPVKFPIFTPTLASDMGIEAGKFLDNALWNENLTDLLLSRTTFLNSSLAANVYMVAAPAGATATSFVQTTLPADQRSGLLTNAALLTSLPGTVGHGPLVSRGLFVAATLLCMPYPGDDPNPLVDASRSQETAQQQVAVRSSQPSCNGCHAQFDPYGLALDNYDRLGRYRTLDDLGRPVDAHTTLPAGIGADVVANGVELAQKLATKPAFTNCMAATLLRYAMVDPSTSVEVPLLPQQAGCATAAVVQRYQNAGGKTFTDLVRATAAAPAFVLRRAAP